MHFVCVVVHKYFSPLSRVRCFVMFESYAIVYICTYDSSNRTKKYLLQTLQRITAAALHKCNYVIIGDTKHSLIPFVCILSDIFTLIPDQ